MRKPYSGGGRPDWPSFMIRSIPPDLWEQVKARARRENGVEHPRINAICLRLLAQYAAHGTQPIVQPDTPQSIKDKLVAVNSLMRQIAEEYEQRRTPPPASEPHTIGTDPPTPENDPIGRFRPADKDEAL